MPPRGSRLACSLRSGDGCQGSFDVYPGEQHGSIAKIEPINWDKPPQQPVVQGAFSVIGDMGMTGQVIVLNEEQWRTLGYARLEPFFYGAILWGKSPFKVINDAQLILKRASR
jgi:hypothetical protein